MELGRLVEPDRGISYGIVQPGKPVADGVPIARVSDVREGRINTEAPLRVARAIEAAYSRTRLRGGELLITIVGTVGETAIVPESLAGWNVARAIAVLPVRHEIGAYWVKLALCAPEVREIIQSRLNTTVQATLNLGDLAKLPITLPPRVDRERIAHILGALDDKIDLNRRMNEALEAMARAIFKDWFVYFGPTRAKLEGRAPYLAPEIWDLFPERLDDDDKPKGWVLAALDDFSMLNPESWSRSNYPEHVDYVDLSNTKWGTIEAPERHNKETAPSRAQRVLRNGDTIVGTVRPGNGSFALVGENGLTGSTGFAVLRPRRAQCREFVYLAATSPLNIERLSHLADGAAYPAVRPEIVYITEIARAGDEIMDAFHRTTASLIDRIEANKLEARTLAATRDLLLPKLMSGEVRMKDADRIVGDVP
jgi:type I restriction enzyme S subunit